MAMASAAPTTTNDATGRPPIATPEVSAPAATEHWIKSELCYGSVPAWASPHGHGSMFATDEERRAAWDERGKALLEDVRRSGMSLVYREIGPLQGRYALPLLVLLPLWLGEVVHRHRELLPPSTQRHLAGGVLGIVALVQAVAWLSNAHRFAVGQSGSWSFLTGDGWAPPPGWPPWALLAAAGAASLAGAAALALSRRDLDWAQ